MPRTTLNIDGAVLRDLKRRAKHEGKSVGELVSELLWPALASGPRGRPQRFSWKSAQMGPPSVDLEDKEAVRRALGDQ